MKYAGIELGGTKVVTGVASNAGTVLERDVMDTDVPATTLERIRSQLARYCEAHEIAALGIASFGPVFVSPDDSRYGSLGDTPKLAWRGTKLLDFFSQAFVGPLVIDTDVNAAALAESLWGAGRSHRSVVYVTVGTGIGAGILIDGKPVHGLLHPEVGHMPAARVAGDDFEGVCPSHGGCIEGLACGPAILARWEATLSELGNEHEAHEVIAAYIAQLLVNIVLTVSPEIVVLGGGVTMSDGLHERVREHVRSYLNDYVPAEQLRDGIDSYIVPPRLGADAGLLGAAALAMSALPS